MKYRTLTLFTLLLAFALRLTNIEAQGIWGDEAFSIYTAKQSIAYITSGGTDVHPPLYHLLLHFWIQLAGVSPLAVRVLSVMWSMVIVASGYALATKLRGGGRPQTADTSTVHRPTFAVAFLIAIAPFQIYYAQETRMYAQVAALCALSLVFFARWLQTGDRRLGAGYFISTLLAIYTEYFAFFILAAEAFFFLWRVNPRNKFHSDSRRLETDGASRGQNRIGSKPTPNGAKLASPVGWRTIIGAHLLLAALYLPWIVMQVGDLSTRASTRANTLPLQSAWDVVSKALGAFFIGTTLDGSAQFVLALLFLVLALIGYLATRHLPFSNLLALGIALPIVGAIASNPLLPYFRERFVLLASAPFIVLIASGIEATSLRITHHALRITHHTSRISLISLISLIFLISLFTLNRYWSSPQFHKGEYDLAIAAIRASAQPHDAVIVYSPIQDALYDYYRIDGLVSYALPKADLNAISVQHPRAWLILYGDPAVYDPNHAAEKFLSARGFKSFYQSYRDGALARYDFASGDALVENRQIKFGDAILLTAYSLPSAITRGSTLPLALQWRTSVRLDENYTVFVHLLGADGKVVAQMDTQPVGGTRPTKTWQVGETIRDNIGMTIPSDVPAAHYQVEVGMYQLQTLKRLEIRDSGDLRVQADALIIGEVEVR